MSNPRRTNGHRRNQLRKRVLAEETHCHLCGHPVDTTLRHGTPLSPELDELDPVSKGGSPYDRDNIRLAHRICNQRRGNRTPNPQPQPTTAPLPTSRPW